MNVYSFNATGRDAKVYSVRLLLSPSELAGLQSAGLVPMSCEQLVGMQDAADAVVAGFELAMHRQLGGVLQ